MQDNEQGQNKENFPETSHQETTWKREKRNRKGIAIESFGSETDKMIDK